jgi:hypothetical protein
MENNMKNKLRVAGSIITGGRFGSYWVAGFNHNRWPLWVGIRSAIDLPALSLVNGDTVKSRITIELFGSLAGGGDLIMSEENTLKVTKTSKTLSIRK